MLHPLFTPRYCQGSAQQPKVQLQNPEQQRELTVLAASQVSTAAMATAPRAPTARICQIPANLATASKKKKPKTLKKKRDYFAYSKVFFKNNHGSHFWPFLSARFNSFSTKIS